MSPGGDDGEQPPSNVIAFKGKRSPDAQAARERLIVPLRLSGLTYEQIAAQTGYSLSQVFRICTEALALPAEERAAARNLEVLRLDRMQAAVWGLAIGGKVKRVEIIDGEQREIVEDAPPSILLAASKQALAISARRSALLGLDEPKQVEITPPAHEVQQIVQQILAATGDAPDIVDADVIEADVLDGDPPEPEADPTEPNPLDDDYEW